MAFIYIQMTWYVIVKVMMIHTNISIKVLANKSLGFIPSVVTLQQDLKTVER